MMTLLWRSNTNLQVSMFTVAHDMIRAYNTCLKEEDPDIFRPTLTLYVQRNHGNDIAIDATLSPSTRKYLQDLVDGQGRSQYLASADSEEFSGRSVSRSR